MSATGIQLRDDAFALLEQRRLGVIRRRQHSFLEFLILHGTGTIEDGGRDEDLPDGVNGVCFGPASKALASAGIIESRRWVPSRRPQSHARPIREWELATDERTVREWMKAHPIPEMPHDGLLPFSEDAA